MFLVLLALTSATATEYSLPNPWLSTPPPALNTSITVPTERKDQRLAALYSGALPLAFYGLMRVGIDQAFPEYVRGSGDLPPRQLAGAALTGLSMAALPIAMGAGQTYAGDRTRASWVTVGSILVLVASTWYGSGQGSTLYPEYNSERSSVGSALKGGSDFFAFATLGLAAVSAIDAYLTAEKADQRQPAEQAP